MTDLYTNSELAFVTAVKTAVAAKYSKPTLGIPSTDFTTAVQTALSAIDDKYELPESGIPESDLATAVQTKLNADNVRSAKVQLNGTTQTPISFTVDTAAELTSTVDASTTLDLHTVGDGGTLIFTIDGTEDTATLNCAAGTSVSGATPSTDIHGETDSKFNISVDGDEAEEVTLTLDSLTTGAAIATEMQTEIRALGGNKALVTVAYDVGSSGKYHITSPTLGTDSAVVITPATSGSITEELKIGEADGGTETAGTGDCADVTAVTRAELITLLNGDLAALTATASGNYIKVTSNTTGRLSSLVAGDSTLKTLVGFAQNAADYGSIGLGYDTGMEDTTYIVGLTLDGTAGASLGTYVGVSNKAASGFIIEQNTSDGDEYVDIIVVGTAASS